MAIDYNAEVLPLYAKLDADASYTQELATQSSRAYDETDESIGAGNEQILINAVPITVTGTVPVSGDASLDDWLTAIQAAVGFTGLTPDMEAAILTQQDGGKVLVIVAVDKGVSTVDITTAAGTPDGLPSLGMPVATVLSGGDLGLGRADQKNEQRILTTLGVLVAHLRLLGNRAESRNLHFVLSRIATGVGSGGFVYSDTTATVSGNVKNPTYTFGAGADELHLTLINEGEGVENTPAIAIDIVVSAADLDTLVSDITTAVGVGNADQLTASNDGGHLKLHSEDGLTITVVSGGNNDAATNKSGLEYGATRSKRNEVAEKVKAEALDYFDTNRRALNL